MSLTLFYNPNSPYVRKVICLARSLGPAFFSQLKLINVLSMPTASDPQLAKANPLAKVPTLITEDGEAVFDSRVIGQWMLEKGKSARPTIKDLQLESLADGILDAALLARYETFLRPEQLRWNDWYEGQLDKIKRSLQVLNEKAAELKTASDIGLGEISVGTALWYLDKRWADVINWREIAPGLKGWFEEVEKDKVFDEMPEA
ncbi:hypothetical protein YB2330_001629 [Saitoella coloradoensis]